jgi:hypothetical protein
MNAPGQGEACCPAPVVTTRVYIKKEGDCGQIAPTILYIAAHSYYN